MSVADLPFPRVSVYAGRAIAVAPRSPSATFRGRRDAQRRGVAASRKDTSVSNRSTDDVDPAGPGRAAQMLSSMRAGDLDLILQKLKLLEFGLYGLQQYGRNAPLDVEDIGPFYRLAEEIESDVLALQERLAPQPTIEPAA